jgi:TolB-like protein/class 3 adenylate cyclase
MERRLAAILAVDVVGYSRLMQQDEAGTFARLRAHRKELFEPEIAAHHGHVFKLMGDGLLAEFASVVEAVECAVALQDGMTRRNAAAPSEHRIEARIGINLGDVIVEKDESGAVDMHGEGVIIANRLQALAEPGGICVSQTVVSHVGHKIAVGFEFVGEHRVKNIAEPVRVYRVRLAGALAMPRLALGRVRHRAAASIAVVAIVVIAIIGASWVWTGRQQPVSGTPSIAVLPFDNLAGDDANGRIADGFTEDLITDLSRYRDFEVIARNSTEVYKGKPADVRLIGKDLNVSYVLEGSFQRQGDRVRISAQLIEARTGRHILSERFDRPATDLFAVQAEVSDKVANMLGGWSGAINQTALTAAKQKQAVDLDAYELFLLGDEARRELSEESLLKAVELLKKAIAADPTLARAHTSLAWTYARLMLFQSDMGPTTQLMFQEARRAIELDPLDARAHTSLGYATGIRGDLKQAEIEYNEALRLNPGSFDVLLSYSCWAFAFGKGQAGAEAVDHAIRLNPNYPATGVDCFRYALFMVGRYEDAIRQQFRLPEEKWNPDGFAMTAGSLAALGRLDEAKAIAGRGVAKFPSVLSIEKFALNRGWSPPEVAILTELMRKAGFPSCASEKDLAGTEKPVRLPECVKT